MKIPFEVHFLLINHIKLTNYLRCASDIAAVGTIFNVFSYDAVSDRDSNLLPSQRRAVALRVEPRLRVIYVKHV